MIFRNYLTTSVLLVATFAFMHFYEASIRAELDAHNFVMREIVEEQKNALNSKFGHVMSERRSLKEEYHDLKDLQEEFRDVKNHYVLLNSNRVESIESVLMKYDVDKSKNQYGWYLSYYAQSRIFNKINEQLDSALELNLVGNKLSEGNDRHVIIKERETYYNVNETYELEFQDVRLFNNYLEEGEISVDFNGNIHKIKKFPYLINKLPDSLALIYKGKDVVTGEVDIVREVHSLKP